MMLLMWLSTVPSDKPSVRAMSLVQQPSCSRPRISICRAVRWLPYVGSWEWLKERRPFMISANP